MEPIGTISEGEWSCLSGMYTSEEADFMTQLLGNCPMIGLPGSSSEIGASSGLWWPSNDPNEGPFYESHEMVGAKLYHFQASCDQDSYYIADKPCAIMVTAHGPMSTEFCVGDPSNKTYLVEGGESSIQESVEETNADHQDQADLDSHVTNDLKNDQDHQLQPDPKLRAPVEELPVVGDQVNNNGGNGTPPRNPKKRPRRTSSGDNVFEKSNRRGSKSQKMASSSNEEQNNAGLSRPASSSCDSDNDNSNGFHEHGGESSSLSSKETQALNLSGKTRAGRGAATDPQSLYARKRREMINERLKILQTLVPNGTKVDISTMLEEAVQYVKFLQLQIKLLSSDDMWMYAPIAYNGIDIGLLDIKVPNIR